MYPRHTIRIGTLEQGTLFDDGSEHLTLPVQVKGVSIQRSRWALALWYGVGLEAFCEQLLRIGKKRMLRNSLKMWQQNGWSENDFRVWEIMESGDWISKR